MVQVVQSEMITLNLTQN